jgi:16S rRNA (uracil1498-N3)-methyltransferase
MCAMVPRFYVPSLGRETVEAELPPEEAAHAARVLRVAAGDRVRVFDGRGLERLATVTRVGKAAVALSLGDAVAAAPEARVRVTLAQALLKADKLDDVIRDAVMLGAGAIRPLVSERCEVPAAAVRHGGRTDRWHRVAVASAKQCGRAVVPPVFPAADLEACLADDDSAVRLMLAEPSLETAGPVRPLTVDLLAQTSSVLVLVGPEGGWSAAEATRAVAAGCRLVTLGRRTLRADAAPLVALSVLFYLTDASEPHA